MKRLHFSFMRVLGLDLGSKRIGLALSDSEANLAFPAGTLRSVGRKGDIQALCRLIDEKDVVEVVVGHPRHLDGRSGVEAEKAENFANGLQRASGIPVQLLDERWTSLEAERSLREMGHDSRRSRQHVDEVAAALILRTYLTLREQKPTATDRPE